MSFTYAVSDGSLAPVATTATRHHPGQRRAGERPGHPAAMPEDGGPRLITQAELLANASDVDGPALTATNLAIAAGNGTLVDNLDGTWSYTPAANDDSAVTFSYSVSDGSRTVAPGQAKPTRRSPLSANCRETRRRRGRRSLQR